MPASIEVCAPAEQEGTKAILRAWLKAPGEAVARDEPIAELETDKVAVEVAAPQAGVLAEQLVAAEEEVAPGQALARLIPGEAAQQAAADLPAPAPKARGAGAEAGRLGRFDPALRLSPSVRRRLVETGFDPARLAGSGRGGRLTAADVAAAAGAAPAAAAPNVEGSRLLPHSPMRRRIAQRMAASLAQAPHVTAVFEADFGAVLAHRDANRGSIVGLTPTAYVLMAAARAMQAVPTVNARWREDALEVFADVDIGVGVALGEAGLIVPVVHKVQALGLEEIAGRLAHLTARARKGALAPADVQGGTFTVSNHGVSGSVLAAPIIINPPQVAILGIGKLEKRVVVREIGGAEAIQVRPMAYVTLTIDHRALDAAQTNAWLTRFCEVIEGWGSE